MTAVPYPPEERATLSSGHWYAVLSSAALGKRAVGRVRFGERVVFWRGADGTAACFADRCPHRGAALSLGRVSDGTLACRYHGFRFDTSGRCVAVPVEDSWPIPDHLRAQTFPVREAEGFIWLWRGPAPGAAGLPPLPALRLPGGTIYGECVQVWPTHYSRCIEGVVDHSHLSFVHTRSLGIFLRDPVTHIRVDRFPGGFRANMLREGGVRHHVDFVYPNVWIQTVKAATWSGSPGPYAGQQHRGCVHWEWTLGSVPATTSRSTARKFPAPAALNQTTVSFAQDQMPWLAGQPPKRPGSL